MGLLRTGAEGHTYRLTGCIASVRAAGGRVKRAADRRRRPVARRTAPERAMVASEPRCAQVSSRSMTDRGLPGVEGLSGLPVHRASRTSATSVRDRPDHRHRCYAGGPAGARALAHQEAYCLSSAFPVCPTFQDWARREAAQARSAVQARSAPPRPRRSSVIAARGRTTTGPAPPAPSDSARGRLTRLDAAEAGDAPKPTTRGRGRRIRGRHRPATGRRRPQPTARVGGAAAVA